MKDLLNNLFKTEIKDKTELIAIMRRGVDTGIIDFESMLIIEAVLQISKLQVRDIMIPRLQMDVLDINDDIRAIATKIITTGHSRFPIIDKEISNVMGIFHSKDLIRYFLEEDNFKLKEHLRQAYFVPEIKKLDALMYEMRLRHSHLAIVVDEFTNVVGIITLEMIVEQIIGEIEDEYDAVDDEQEIIKLREHVYRVKGQCKLHHLNNKLNLNWIDERVETVGGFLIKFLGRIPLNNEVLDMGSIKVEIINADSRRIKLLIITELK